jgi:branched-chain amino acid transport system substrate-binding protein
MEADISRAVEAAGGKIVGKERHPLNAEDFSKQLMNAQASGAKVVALANAGNDTVNAIKLAALLGLVVGGQTLAGLVLVLSDIHNIGLDDAKGLNFLTAFYWNRDEASRAWSAKFEERTHRKPGMVQAGVYSSVRHYLKAVQAAGTDEAKAVVAKMKEMPVEDAFAHGGKIRPDGRMVHDMFLVKVKSPSESNGPWDYYNMVRTIPGDEAFRPLAESACPLAK